MVLAELAYSTRNTRGQAGFPHNVVSINDIGNAVSFMIGLLAPGARSCIFCSDLIFFCWSKSLHVQMKSVEDVEGDPQGAKKEHCTCSELKANL